MNNKIQQSNNIWEEKNSTENNQNLTKSAETDKCVTIGETKNELNKITSKDTTKTRYYHKNKNMIIKKQKQYNLRNKEKIQNYKTQYDIDNKNNIKLKKKTYYQKNKAHITKRVKTYIKNSRVKQLISQRDRQRHLRLNYGLTLEDYSNMAKLHNHSCAICKKHQSNFKRLLSIDHCHKTGKIRGLLCNDCNVGIGRLGDDINLLNAAIDYLEKHNAPQVVTPTEHLAITVLPQSIHEL